MCVLGIHRMHRKREKRDWTRVPVTLGGEGEAISAALLAPRVELVKVGSIHTD